ncbi:MAG: type II secretion system F family protein, partial [Verrucomicrobiota bacterium]|nr:type II secretion system F family protein [Verrucomicrobiota bacterium]
MPLLILPRQLASRGEFYHQLDALTSAGIGIMQGLEMVARKPPSSWYRKLALQAHALLLRGSTFSEALLNSGEKLSEFDLSLLDAGEKSGRLDACFRLLAEYYKERAQLLRKVLSGLAYPFFIVHFAIFIFPVTLLINLVWQGAIAPWVQHKLSILLPLYAILAILIFVTRGDRGERWRAIMEQFTGAIPMFGTAQR